MPEDEPNRSYLQSIVPELRDIAEAARLPVAAYLLELVAEELKPPKRPQRKKRARQKEGAS